MAILIKHKSGPLVLWDMCSWTTFTHQCPAINFIIRLLLSAISCPPPSLILCFLFAGFLHVLPSTHLPVSCTFLHFSQLSNEPLWLYVCQSLFSLSLLQTHQSHIFLLMSAPSSFRCQTDWKWNTTPDFKATILYLLFTQSFSLSLHPSGSVFKQKSTNHQRSRTVQQHTLNYCLCRRVHKDTVHRGTVGLFTCDTEHLETLLPAYQIHICVINMIRDTAHLSDLKHAGPAFLTIVTISLASERHLWTLWQIR